MFAPASRSKPGSRIHFNIYVNHCLRELILLSTRCPCSESMKALNADLKRVVASCTAIEIEINETLRRSRGGVMFLAKRRAR